MSTWVNCGIENSVLYSLIRCNIPEYCSGGQENFCVSIYGLAQSSVTVHALQAYRIAGMFAGGKVRKIWRVINNSPN